MPTTPRDGQVLHIHIGNDDHSRLDSAEFCTDAKADTAIAVLRRAAAWYAEFGITVETVCRPIPVLLEVVRLARHLR